MELIKKLISYNQEKLEYLDKCLTANQMAKDLIKAKNINALSELSKKKKTLITSVEVIDDKILSAMSDVKKKHNVKNLQDIKDVEKEFLTQLRDVSILVVEKMVELKISDDEVLSRIDDMFASYDESVDENDTKKVEYYTNEFFARL